MIYPRSALTCHSISLPLYSYSLLHMCSVASYYHSLNRRCYWRTSAIYSRWVAAYAGCFNADSLLQVLVQSVPAEFAGSRVHVLYFAGVVQGPSTMTLQWCIVFVPIPLICLSLNLSVGAPVFFCLQVRTGYHWGLVINNLSYTCLKNNTVAQSTVYMGQKNTDLKSLSRSNFILPQFRRVDMLHFCSVN